MRFSYRCVSLATVASNGNVVAAGIVLQSGCRTVNALNRNVPATRSAPTRTGRPSTFRTAPNAKQETKAAPPFIKNPRRQRKRRTRHQKDAGFERLLERATGIEPASSAWKAGVLPLNYARDMVGTTGFEPAASCSQSTRATRLRHVPTSRASIIEVSLHLGNARFALPQGTHAVYMSRSDVYCECNQPRDRLPRG